MATVQAIKQLEEKNVASEITLMVWSDRMDLVALANVKGEVALHRLAWTKAWSLNAPKDGLTVKGITWRPDGKIIAIAYSSGEVILVKVENKSILHSIETESDISCICWTQDRVYVKDKAVPVANEESKQNQYMTYIDVSANFLPEPSSQQFDSSGGCTEENQKSNLLQDQNDLNLLLIGTTDGVVHVRVFGCFPCAILNLNSHQYLGHKCSIESIHLIEGLSKMFITLKDGNNNVKIVYFNSGIFKSHTNELFAVALKHIKLMSLMTYLSSTITTITESWESILLEMDNKLSKYAGKVAEGGVTADFLDLLMFGLCSEEMKDFLIHDLTKKGLEKFGQTIEMSYSNIQKLVLKYVMKFGQNITYHLAELRGMARLEHRYKVLGLSEETITEAIISNGAFLIKGGEMQQIINHSIINYKAFFRWLYTAIMHVMDEPIPNEIPKMTQQDLAYITEFLQNFDHIGSKNSKRSGFIMERLGQYLIDAPLTIEPNMSGNEWTHFLKQNRCVEDHLSILKHYEDMSLIQQYADLKFSIENIFAAPKDVISEQFEIAHVFGCFRSGEERLKMSQIDVNKETILFAFLRPPGNVHALQIHVNNSVRCGNIHFSQFLSPEQECFEGNYNVLDIKLYSSTVLSVLLQENSAAKSTVLYQVPLTAALEKFSDVDNIYGEIFRDNIANINASSLTPKLFKNVEGMIASLFAVSGSRRVGIVLAENKRKVRLYEMEGEEEEDEDADMTNSTMKEGDMSVQDATVSNL
ncbi:anaphase-promoting complex subunit 4 [Asbolus verrucosus]|uniref:Anaphase-promoting complex subunit 4 n=1 Tax=Asbolus verrucosus TaxID=1661398 RepID=A0A482VZ72_ASBVE|nr:anaphase-promoting complex subunit 4 [Asbolus verrucosus]